MNDGRRSTLTLSGITAAAGAAAVETAAAGMLAMGIVFAGLMLARLVGLALALMVARRVVAPARTAAAAPDEAGLLPEIREALALVVAILRGHFISRCAGCGWFWRNCSWAAAIRRK